MNVLVVLPTYNEAENIDRVVRRIRKALAAATVLVVDDGSPDGTADIAERIGKELGNVEVLRRHEKSGLGSAYRAGFRWGLERGFDVCVEMDADLQHEPEALPGLVGPLDRGARPGHRVALRAGRFDPRLVVAPAPALAWGQHLRVARSSGSG